MRRPTSHLLALILAFSAASAVAGEGAAVRDAGDYAIHYNAMPSNRLDPEVAERHGLERSEERCVVTVAVIEKRSGNPVEATLMASATREDGRMHHLDMRKIMDEGGVYYVGEVPLTPPASVEFTLEIQPGPDMAPHTIRFQRTFGEF